MSALTLFRDDDVITLDSVDDAPRRIGRSSLLWLDLDRDPDELQSVCKLFDVDESVARRLAESGDPSPGHDDHGSYIHVTACVPERASDGAELTRIDCLVADRWVATIHDRPIEVLEMFRERTGGSGATGRMTGTTFLAALLDWVLGEYARAFEGVEAALEELDIRSLEGAHGDPEEALRHLVGLRRDLGSLQRSLTAHREPILALTHPELDALSNEESARRFAGLADRLEITVQAGRDARGSIVGSFDVLMARTEHRTNEILKILTLASVVFLPGSLIAGILGMNFKPGLFTHAFLFWFVVGFIATMIATAVVAARRRGWV